MARSGQCQARQRRAEELGERQQAAEGTYRNVPQKGVQELRVVLRRSA